MTEVWGPPSRRRRMKELGKAGATGGGAGGFFEGCADCGGCDVALFEGEIGALVGAILLLGVVFMLGYWLISAVIRYVRRRRQILKPKGAIAKAPRVGPATGMTGIVNGANPLPSPLSKRNCVGYGLLFTCRQGWSRNSAMLRDASSCGFDVSLDSGNTVRIPAGRIVLEMQGADSISPSGVELERYLLAIDPSRHKSDDLEPFPQDHIRELLIRHGDRVEIRSPVDAVVDTKAAPTGYRESAATLLEARGTPHLRLVW